MNNLASLTKQSKKIDFLAYFKDKLPDHDQKWEKVYKHFSNFACGKCTFVDITVDLCEKFKNYLLNAQQLSHEHLDKIGMQDTRRQFLTANEVQALYNTPCRERLQ